MTVSTTRKKFAYALNRIICLGKQTNKQSLIFFQSYEKKTSTPANEDMSNDKSLWSYNTS